MSMDLETNRKLQAALLHDEFAPDFHRLLRIMGATLRLNWTGTREDPVATLWLVIDGGMHAFAQYRPRRIDGMCWVAGNDRVEDFRERFIGLLQHHGAELGMGISRVKRIAQFSIGFPRASRAHRTSHPYSMPAIAVRHSHDGRVFSEYEAEPAEAAA